MLLQRYLNLLKQKERKSRHITLTVPEEHKKDDDKEENIFNRVLRNVNPHFQKNTENILHKILDSKNEWTEHGWQIYL